MIDPSTFGFHGQAQVDLLRKSPREEVVKSLLQWLAGQLRDPEPDWDTLPYAGMAVGAAGFSGVDEIVCGWAAQAGAAVAHKVAGYFLDGYWRRAAHAHILTVDCFMRAAALPLEDWPSDYSAAVFPLYALLGSQVPELTAERKEEIRLLLIRRLEQAERTDTYKDYIRYLLRNLRTSQG